MHAFKYAIQALLLLWLLAALSLGYIALSTRPFIYMSAAAVPESELAMVLGASVIGTSTLSLVLRERTDMAIELYKTKKVSKILVSGDSTSPNHREVEPVAAYIVAAGVPAEDVLLDRRGLDTYSSMYRAKTLFGVHSLIIVTQHFHLPRALFIASALGMKAYGVDASEGEPFIFNYAREVPASLKAVFDVVSKRIPQ